VSIDLRRECPGIRAANAAYITKLTELILPPIRMAARDMGYAIAVHGSMARDIDLVAIPWTETAQGAELLVETIRGIVCGVFGSCYKSEVATKKPHGRLAWTLIHGGFHAEIDLSIMPIVPKPE
jgi:hypothetical protein